MTGNRKRLLLYGMLTLVMMTVIFLFSSQDGSESGGLSAWLLSTPFGRTLMRLLPHLSDQGIEYDLRKYAHMGEYALLAMPAFGFFRELLVGRKIPAAFLSALLFCFLYACSDELHQRFIPDRSGQFSDVLIDTAGVLLGLIFACAGCFLKMRKEQK